MTKLELFGLVLPEIKKGDDLASLIVHEAERQCGGVQENDIIIVTSKIISKAKGYIIPMPKKFSRDAIFLSKITKKPLWECELILKLSRRIVAAIPTTEIILRFNLHKILSKNPERAKKVLMEDPVILVVENARGSLCSDAELDLSNVPKGFVYLPPPDPDLEARELREKIDSLEKENYSLSLQIANLKELEIENRELKKALDLNLQKEFNLVLAEVSGKDIGTKDTILITAGKRDGVLEDMPVITPEKILVGKVVKSYKNFSEVALLSKKNFSFDVKIKSKEEQNKKDISAIAKGEGNSEISLDLVPLTAPVSKDDIIISDNMGKIFPKGLLVGYIKDIKKSDTAVFQKIKAQHIFDIKKQRTLFVITGYKE